MAPPGMEQITSPARSTTQVESGAGQTSWPARLAVQASSAAHAPEKPASRTAAHSRRIGMRTPSCEVQRDQQQREPIAGHGPRPNGGHAASVRLESDAVLAQLRDQELLPG